MTPPASPIAPVKARQVFFECLRLCEEKGLAEESRHARHLITELTWRDYFRFYAGKHGALGGGVAGAGDFEKEVVLFSVPRA